MSGEVAGALGELFGKLFGWIAAIIIVIYLIMLAIAVTAILAMIAVGLISLIVAKRKPLVEQNDAAAALASAIGWACALALGCIVGSFGLMIAEDFAWGGIGAGLEQKYGLARDGMGAMLFLDRWVLGDSYRFLFSTTATLYLANRVNQARKPGAGAWLDVVPPVFAMLVRAGSACLDRFSALISGASAGVRLPSGSAAVGF